MTAYMEAGSLAALQESNRRAAASANWSTALRALSAQKEDVTAVRVQVAEWRLKEAQQQAEEAEAKVVKAHMQVTALVERATVQQRQHEEAMVHAQTKWRQQSEQQRKEHEQETVRLTSLYEEEKAAKVGAPPRPPRPLPTLSSSLRAAPLPQRAAAHRSCLAPPRTSSIVTPAPCSHASTS